MSVWGSIDWEDSVLAASKEAPGNWVDDMAVDVAVSCIEERYRLLVMPESYPPKEWAGHWEAEVYLDRANLSKLRDAINVALERGA